MSVDHLLTSNGPAGRPKEAARVAAPEGREGRAPSMAEEASNGGASAINLAQFGVLLAILVAVAFPEVLSGSHTFFYRDFALFGYPLASYHRAQFWNGELPFWNPFNNCGVPFLAQWNTLVLYPGSLIYLLFPLPWSLSLFSLIHLWLAGLGMFCLARSWTNHGLAAAVAGIAFSLNGLMLHAVMWPNNIAALGWMPWVVLGAERAWRQGGLQLMKGAVVGTLQMLAGAPEINLFTWLIIGLIWLVDAGKAPPRLVRMSLRFILLMLLVAAFSAPQLLPFLDLLRHSHRTTQFSAGEWSMPSWGWANFFVPLFHCSKSVIGVFSQTSQQWTSSYYVGIGTLGLGVFALGHRERIHVWALIGLSLASLLVALGSNGPLLPALTSWLPFLGGARYPIKFVVIALFALPLLAAFGVAFLCASEFKPALQARRRILLGLVGILLALLVGTIVWTSSRQPALGEQINLTAVNGLNRTIFLMLAFGALVWALQTTDRLGRRLLQWSALIALAADLITHVPRQNPTLLTDALKPKAVALSDMPRLGEGRAMIAPRVQSFLGYAATPDRLEYHLGHQRTLFGDLNLIYQVPKVNGFYSLYLAEGAAVEALASQPDCPVPNGLLDFLGVSQISANTGWFDWQKRTNFLPFITAGQRPVFADRKTALRALTDPAFASGDTIFFPEEAEVIIGAKGRVAVQLGRPVVTPQRIEVSAQATEPTVLIIAQNFYHRWQAFVDDQPARLWPANVAFQGLEIPPGTHQVRLEYRDPAFWLGILIAGGALICCVLSALWWRRQGQPRRRHV